ncbi:MAG: S24 family peptidase [Thioalkalispiraceae bacterium]|jgi:SOS-response transcriptional repressor LexA
MDLGGCGNSEPFALQVTDNSMEPEFKKGCIIVIDPGGVIEHGCYVFAQVENGFIFRQLVIEDNVHYLQPLHEDYLHEKCPVDVDDIKGVIISQAGATGKRSERKKYTKI